MNLLVVEDHPIVVAGCRALFQQEDGYSLRHVSSIVAARAAIDAEYPDVFVVDINMPDGSGIDFIKDVLKHNPNANTVVFSMSDAPALVLQVMELGIRGFVSKNGDPALLRDAVQAVFQGKRWLPAELVQEIALMRTSSSSNGETLSERQLEILRLLARGKNMSEIAHDVGVCYKTVAADCTEMRHKLNARTSSEMVRIASQLRLV